jgi:hypothetical protein
MTASAARVYVHRYGVSPGRSGVVFTNNNSGLSHGARSRRGGHRGARRRRFARAAADARLPRRSRAQGCRRHRREGLETGRRSRDRERSRAERLACDFLAVSGGWNPAVHLACHRGAKPAWDDKLACFLPPETGPALRAVGAAAGRFALSDCLKDGAETGRRPRPTAASRPRRRHPEGREGARLRHHAAVVGEGVEDQGLRRPAERCHREGRAAGGAGRLQRRRVDQALHDARHGDRPGQAVQRQRARHSRRGDRPHDSAGRHHHVPPVLHAGFHRRAGRPLSRQPLPAARKTALHDWAEELGAVFVEAGLWYRAQWFPQGRRDRLARERHPRGADGARAGRRLRRLHARQDRRPGPGCGRVPQPAVLQRLRQAAGGQGALRPDAARGRHRVRRRHHEPAGRRPFLHDHHHGQCRARHVAHRVLPSGAVARPRRAVRLGHRAVGASRGGRPHGAGDAGQDRRRGLSTRPSPISPRCR